MSALTHPEHVAGDNEWFLRSFCRRDPAKGGRGLEEGARGEGVVFAAGSPQNTPVEGIVT